MITLLKCPACGHTSFTHHVTCRDHLVTKEEFQIVACDSCELLLTNPRPANENLSAYYESDQYVSHKDRSNSLINSLYRIARYFTLQRKLRIINQISEENVLLDFGCGTGDFLETCKKDNWHIHGFEPNEQASAIAQAKAGIPIYENLADLGKLPSMSIITLWHVLEHVPDISETIDLLKATLSPKGKILIAVPNHRSYDASVYGAYWAAYDVPRHLYHFSQASMCTFLAKHGLKIIKQKPMKLDSFYVSMLSEMYRQSHFSLVRAFVNGWKSNVYAKEGMNFSSMIYIAQQR
jgi:2-polyprenyl-3-methyl-5-hydroxy-6-metoxy-1,4-benzoquinol methylase